MQITVLAALVIAMTLIGLPLPQLPWEVALPAAAAYVLIAGILAGVNSLLACRGLEAAAGIPRRVVMRHNRLALALQAWLALGLGGAIWAGQGQWLDLVQWLRPVPLAPTAAVMTPFILALVLSWVLDYPFHRAYRTRLALQHGQDFLFAAPQAPAGAEAPLVAAPAAAPRVAGPWSRREFLGYNLRHEFLFIAAPVSLIVLLRDVLEVYVAPRMPESVAGWVLQLGTAACSLGVFLVAPAMIVRIWRTCPLGEGTLRSALEAMAQRMHIRFRRILIWQSGGLIANAAVMGLAARFRYVLLSDGLLEQMSGPDILAVFAHEAQHVKGRHILYSLLFAFSTAVLCIYAVNFVGMAFKLGETPVEMGGLALLMLAWVFGFGWISRRFERQSDVNGAWLMGQMQAATLPADLVTLHGAAVFAHALEAIAMLNGISMTHRNWRHGSIESRINYLLELGGAGGSRRAIDRTVAFIKIGLWLAIAASAAVIVIVEVLGRLAGQRQ